MASYNKALLLSHITVHMSHQGRREYAAVAVLYTLLQGPRHLLLSCSSIPWMPLGFEALPWIFCMWLANKARVSHHGVSVTYKVFQMLGPSLSPIFHLPKFSPNCRGDRNVFKLCVLWGTWREGIFRKPEILCYSFCFFKHWLTMCNLNGGKD